MSLVRAMFDAVPIRYWCGPVLLLFLLMSLPIVVWQLDQTSRQLQTDHRNLQLDNTRWQRYVTLLSATRLKPLIQATNRTTFEVALRETAQSLQANPEIQIDSFQVGSTQPYLVDDELGGSITPLQINIEATLLHAPALLTILSQISNVAGWRVAEVRGCAMQRLASEPRIAAACSIDIHHWSWAADSTTEH